MAKLTNTEIDAIIAKLKREAPKLESKPVDPTVIKKIKILMKDKIHINAQIEKYKDSLSEINNELSKITGTSYRTDVDDAISGYMKKLEVTYNWSDLKNDLVIDNISWKEFDIKKYIDNMKSYINK